MQAWMEAEIKNKNKKTYISAKQIGLVLQFFTFLQEYSFNSHLSGM